MDVGVLIPQGWKREYAGWDPARAWARTVELARQAEELGFESEWVFDHFTTVPEPTDEITFESFSTLSALAMVTKRVRMGHMVICTGFRNPALTAKLAATIDVISGGRFELGIGGGWKQDEWIAYGYGFPPIAERLGALSDHLEIIRRMLEPGRAT
ncbi:MAG TPA: LLM class flavin-dependent oxidoreductase, partial [Methylomirabilota bacterium]|nr:LLM class flavin-dependent oxidoreductase [Methylomirabilota bacterium]